MRHPVPAGISSWLRRFALSATFAAVGATSATTHAQCNFDVDANGQVDALTDGLLILRAAFGLAGPSLTQGALGFGATRGDPAQIVAYINTNKGQYDLDGNGTFDALTDGLMLIRYLFGLSGATVTSGSVGVLASRPDWLAINGYLLSGCGTGPADDLKDAARLLTQATWGPKYSEIYGLAGSPAPRVDNWLANQFALPRLNHIDWIIARAALGDVSMTNSYESFWSQALTGNDQLRQRVAFALSQILVVSEQKDGLGNPWLISGYLDVLARNAFGNYRTLLEEITKSPAMARYLDHMCNDKETATRSPNENYAR